MTVSHPLKIMRSNSSIPNKAIKTLKIELYADWLGSHPVSADCTTFTNDHRLRHSCVFDFSFVALSFAAHFAFVLHHFRECAAETLLLNIQIVSIRPICVYEIATNCG